MTTFAGNELLACDKINMENDPKYSPGFLDLSPQHNTEHLTGKRKQKSEQKKKFVRPEIHSLNSKLRTSLNTVLKQILAWHHSQAANKNQACQTSRNFDNPKKGPFATNREFLFLNEHTRTETKVTGFYF